MTFICSRRLLACAAAGWLFPTLVFAAEPVQSLALRGVVPKVVRVGLQPSLTLPVTALQTPELVLASINGGSNAGPYQLLLRAPGLSGQNVAFAFDGRSLEFRDGTAQVASSRRKAGTSRQSGQLTMRLPAEVDAALSHGFLLIVRPE